RAEPNPGAANDHGVHHALGVFLRLHLSTRDDAVDFLRVGRAAADDLLHRVGAGRYSPRRKPCRFLATSRDSDGHGLCPVLPLRAPIQKENRLTAAPVEWSSYPGSLPRSSNNRATRAV